MGQNVDVARALYDAFAQGDVATVLGSMDPSIEWHEAEGNPYDPGGPFVGPQVIAEELFMKLATEWDDFRVSPKEFVETDGGVVVEGRYTGVYKATGTPMDAEFAHVWKLRDGKITTFKQYTDTHQMRQVMGASG